MFVGIDANFWLKRMNVSTEERDPGLNNGYAYIVGTAKFKEYLEEYDKKIPEAKSTCHNHDAIKLVACGEEKVQMQLVLPLQSVLGTIWTIPLL